MYGFMFHFFKGLALYCKCCMKLAGNGLLCLFTDSNIGNWSWCSEQAGLDIHFKPLHFTK